MIEAPRRAALASVLAASVVVACSDAPLDAMARVHVTTRIHDADLYVDARPVGRLADGMEIALPPGAHQLEARRGPRVIATERVVVRSGERVTRSLFERPFNERVPPRHRRPRRV